MISPRKFRLLVENPSLEMILTEWNDVSGKFEPGSHPIMKLRPEHDRLLILFQIQSNFELIRHDGINVDFVYLYYFCYVGLTGTQSKRSLSGHHRQPPISELHYNILALQLPPILWDVLYLSRFDFDV